MVHKHYLHKLLNTDDAPHLVDPDELINVENMRLSKSGSWENIKGTTLLQQAIYGDPLTEPPGCIGGCSDETERFLVWFVHTENLGELENGTNQDLPHYNQILLYDRKANLGYQVVTSGDVKLNFRKDKRIQACIINNTLYWTDDYNHLRALHLGAAIPMLNPGVTPLESNWTMQSPVSEIDIMLAKCPYPLVPSIVKVIDANHKTNRIANDSFQFAVQYIYFGGEKSVLSPWSISSMINKKGEDGYNKIIVSLSSSVKIPQSVRFVRLVVLHNSTNKAFVFKTFDRLADNSIDQHNVGTAALTAAFYNNSSGEMLTSNEQGVVFHSVPDLAKTIAPAKNRLWVSNYKDGKDTPPTTSLNITASSVNPTSPTVGVYQTDCTGTEMYFYHDNNLDLDVQRSVDMVIRALMVQLTYGVPQAGWYVIKSTRVKYTGSWSGDNIYTPPIPDQYAAVPATVQLSDLEFVGASISWLDKPKLDPTPTQYTQYFNVTVVNSGQNTEMQGGSGGYANAISQFKGGGEYQYGVVFFDDPRTRCGVVTNETLKKQIEERKFDMTSFVPSMSWSLVNNADVNVMKQEIPDYAKSYAIVRTLNLKTRLFVQGYDNTAKYYLKNADGTWNDGSSEFISGTKYADAIGIDTASLTQSGLGYKFTEGSGDICVLTFEDNVPHYLPVIDMVGGRVFLPPENFDSLLNKKIYFEIYTPYLPSETEPFYEIGQVFPIVDPGTDTRRYSVTSGNVNGDVFVLQRKLNDLNITVEAMSPNDKYWGRWITDAGQIHIITTKGAVRNKTGIRYSDTFIPGTDTNGLSSFQALNQDQLPIELGETMKLILISKAQSEGTVMLGIGKSESCSIYIGEASLMDAKGNKVLVKSDGVIGQINPLSGSLGTLHPESVALLDGRVFWIDILKGVIASYSANGLFAISNYKIATVTKVLCNKILDMMDAGQDVVIPGGVDPFNKEYLFSVPQTEVSSPDGALSDYTPALTSPYGFYDGAAKTWVYKIDSDRFGGSGRWISEYFISLGDSLFGFKDGNLYSHNSSATYDSMYGLTVKPGLAFIENGKPDSSMKIFRSLALETNMTPSFTHIRTEVPFVQSSDLLTGDWNTINGIHYAAILKDRLSPNTPGDVNRKLFYGDDIRGQWAKIWMEFTTSGQRVQIRFINVGYDLESNQENL